GERRACALAGGQLAAGGVELGLLSGDLSAQGGGLVALGRDDQHPAGDHGADGEHDHDHDAVAGGHLVPPVLVVVVVVVEAPVTAVTPEAPALATGWKKTTRSKLGELAPQPWEPFDDVAAVFDICESSIVTRVTPLIRRSCDIRLATSSWERVHPLSSKAGAVTSLRSEPVLPDPEPPVLAPGTTVPTTD